MTLTLPQLAAKMRDLDTCLLTTRDGDGITARPMSNNQDVEFDGTSWFFVHESSAMVGQVEADPNVAVTYSTKGLWVVVQGTCRAHTDRALMGEHWDPDIDRWFTDGVDTLGLRLLEVSATRIRYWTFEDGDGEIDLG